MQSHRLRNRAFTLIEMVVVIAVMVILLTLAGPIFSGLTNSYSPATVATAISGQLERARSHAVANNTYVWVRLGAVREEPNDFFIGVFESLDGTDNPNDAKGAWNHTKFANFKLSNELTENFERPEIPISNQLNSAAWIRFNPAGEAWVSPGDATETRIKMIPPATTQQATLETWSEIGIQPTRGGKVIASDKSNVAAVHLSGLIGKTTQYTP